jgi:hypothetical protein
MPSSIRHPLQLGTPFLFTSFVLLMKDPATQCVFAASSPDNPDMDGPSGHIGSHARPFVYPPYLLP